MIMALLISSIKKIMDFNPKISILLLQVDTNTAALQIPPCT